MNANRLLAEGIMKAVALYGRDHVGWSGDLEFRDANGGLHRCLLGEAAFQLGARSGMDANTMFRDADFTSYVWQWNDQGATWGRILDGLQRRFPAHFAPEVNVDAVLAGVPEPAPMEAVETKEEVAVG